jgi:hypothetical protein
MTLTITCSHYGAKLTQNGKQYLHFQFSYCREFAMSTTFPRREFGANEDGQTLRDLQLVPTAVILILPVRLCVVMYKQQSL